MLELKEKWTKSALTDGGHLGFDPRCLKISTSMDLVITILNVMFKTQNVQYWLLLGLISRTI